MQFYPSDCHEKDQEEFDQEYYQLTSFYKLLEWKSTYSPYFLARNVLGPNQPPPKRSNSTSSVLELTHSSIPPNHTLLLTIFRSNPTNPLQYLYHQHAIVVPETRFELPTPGASTTWVLVYHAFSPDNDEINLFQKELSIQQDKVLSIDQCLNYPELLAADSPAAWSSALWKARCSFTSTRQRNTTYLISPDSPNSEHLIKTRVQWRKQASTFVFGQVTDGSRQKQKGKRPPKLKIWFHYLYHDMLRRNSELLDTPRCPWCFFTAESLDQLVCHLVCCHFRFRFQVHTGTDNAIHINVIPQKKAALDGDNAQGIYDPYVYIRRYSRHQAKKIDSLPAIQLPKAPRAKAGPLKLDGSQRQYFHSRTGAVVLEDEVDYDSDDDVDEEWILKQSEKLLDEFEDVSLEEKEMMKMWNRLVHDYKIMADFDVHGACVEFAKTYGKEILSKGLRHNFLFHLFNLWDYSLLKGSSIVECIELVDKQATIAPSAVEN